MDRLERVNAVNTAIREYSAEMRPPDVKSLRLSKMHDVHSWHLITTKKNPCSACGATTVDMLTPDVGSKPFVLCKDCFTHWKQSESIPVFKQTREIERQNRMQDALKQADEMARTAPRSVKIESLMLPPDIISELDHQRGKITRAEFISELLIKSLKIPGMSSD